jgi:DNA-binding transcriptional regulator YiaG
MQCVISNCPRPSFCWGWCRAHYTSWLRYADPTARDRHIAAAGESSLQTFERLAAVETDDCVIWPRDADQRDGYRPYGRMSIGSRSVRVHVEALRRRAGERPPGKQAAHSCGNARCMNYRHLRWATPAENMADKERHGRVMRGQLNHNSKLSASQVQEIRRRYHFSTATQMELAREFGVSQPAISKIVRGVSYAPS